MRIVTVFVDQAPQRICDRVLQANSTLTVFRRTRLIEICIAYLSCWGPPAARLALPGMATSDMISVVRFYIEKVLKQVKGMKVLLLDPDTTKIVSLVYGQTEILKHEVFLVERLDSERKDPLLHLKVTSCSSHAARSCCINLARLASGCFCTCTATELLKSKFISVL